MRTIISVIVFCGLYFGIPAAIGYGVYRLALAHAPLAASVLTGVLAWIIAQLQAHYICREEV